MKKISIWTTDSIADLTGKIVLITGANSGLGFQAARVFAVKHATVIMACRDAIKGNNARKEILEEVSDANLVSMQLDLARLKSIRAFALEFKKSYKNLDILINNAGVMTPPYGTTEDGFELQIGINHFGHFALTGLLLDTIMNSPKSRIVSVSSLAHRMGKINFDDINWKKKYSKWAAYGQSKLANLLFIYEFDRRLKAKGAGTIAAAAHPGFSNTNLQKDMGIFKHFNFILAQPPHKGVLPILYAATAKQVQGGDFFGPDGLYEIRGYPKKASSSKESHDITTAKRLWELSEKETGVEYLSLR